MENSLKPQQLKAIELLIKNYKYCVGDSPRMTLDDIAAAVGVTRKTLYNWMRTDAFATEYDRRIREENRYMQAAAQATIISLLESSSDKVRLDAAKDILDRAGCKASEKITVEGKGIPVVISGADQLED